MRRYQNRLSVIKVKVTLNLFILNVTTLSRHTGYNNLNTAMTNSQIKSSTCDTHLTRITSVLSDHLIKSPHIELIYKYLRNQAPQMLSDVVGLSNRKCQSPSRSSSLQISFGYKFCTNQHQPHLFFYFFISWVLQLASTVQQDGPRQLLYKQTLDYRRRFGFQMLTSW